MHRTSIAAALLPLTAGLLLAACAQKKMEPAADTPAAPAPAPMEASMLPSAAAKPIALDKAVLPEGGTLDTGTLRTGKDGWAAHGETDGVAWRFGTSDDGFLRVAGEPGIEWQYIQVAQSWGVKCMVDGNATPCTLLRLAPVESGGMVSGGLALDEHLTCVRALNTAEPATIVVDNNGAVTLPPPDLCVSGADSDALQQQMLAGRSVTIAAGFYPKGPPKTIALPTHGLKQALAVRAWILDKYHSGDLSPAE